MIYFTLFLVFFYLLCAATSWIASKGRKSFLECLLRELPSPKSIQTGFTIAIASFFIYGVYSFGYDAGSEATSDRIYDTFESIAPGCNQTRMKYSLMKREYEYWEEKAATIARKNKKSSFVKAVNDFFTPKISQAKGE